MKINDFIFLYKPQIKNSLNDYLSTRRKESPSDLPYFIDVIDNFKRFAPEGKLFRGILVLAGNALTGKPISSDALNVAAAVEIIHSTLLIHDDIMDNDKLRRGSKALFAEYKDKGRLLNVTDPKLYGQSLAICAGDVGFFLAYEFIASVSLGDRSSILRTLSRELQYVGAMQMSDVDLGMKNYEPLEEEIISVYRYKTGRYTISLPLTLGASLGGAPELLIKQLDAYGEELGILFQIRDDELSLFGREEITGKPVGSDIRENKKTLLRYLLFKHSKKDASVKLKKIFGNKNMGEEDLKNFRDIYDTSEAKLILKEKIERSLKNLHDQIDIMDIGVEWKELLHTFTDYIVTRDK